MENRTDEFNDLRELVDQLEKIKDKNDKAKIVSKLQEIESELLCDYHLEISDIRIYPLLVEAYYKSEYFEDEFTHNLPGQRDRLGEVYIHEIGRGGIDICLSNGDYALSILIKNSLVKIPNINNCDYYETYFTQTQLYDFLKNDNNCGFKKDKEKGYYELKTKARITSNNEFNENSDVVFLQRKGLETQKDKDLEHFDCLLAAFSIKNVNIYPLTIEKGKESAVAHFLFQNDNIEANDDNIISYLGYRSKNVKKILNELQLKKNDTIGE